MIPTDNWRNDFTKVNTIASGKSLDFQIKALKALTQTEGELASPYNATLSKSIIDDSLDRSFKELGLSL